MFYSPAARHHNLGMEPYDVVAMRRERLKEVIKTQFDGKQTRLVEETGINAGELSGLLRTRYFGEKKARSLEAALKLPRLWLDGLAETEKPRPKRHSLTALTPDQLMLAEAYPSLPPEKKAEWLERMAQDPDRYKTLLDALLTEVSQQTVRVNDRRKPSSAKWDGVEKRKDKAS